MAKRDPFDHPSSDPVPNPRPGDPVRGPAGAEGDEPKHRFRFGERWERHRQRRSVSRAWLILGLDLALLLIIVTLTRMLVKQLQ